MNLLLQANLKSLQLPLLTEKHVRIDVLRLDQLHPQISGNKYFKLKYNLQEAQNQGYTKVLSFGGAFSNHIYALAAACKMMNLETIGIIRGEKIEPLNPTLSFAEKAGMHLHFISRESYKQKDQAEFKKQLETIFGDFYLIPEGGSNGLALAGIKEIMTLIESDFEYIATSCGTGATMAGLMLGLKGSQKVLGFSALKGGDFLWGDMQEMFQDYFQKYPENIPQEPLNEWMKTKSDLLLEYHFGGYAKNKPALAEFMADFETEQEIPIEWIYTGKMFFGLLDLVKKDYFKPNTRIIALHTGGLR
jgi:1-aminocyclopropane-1-carboxylate deaminase/D-cysteine desulfhydrase-like pyridoxal-dependent ACC family enzyme